MKNNISISVIVALVVALGVVVTIGKNEAVAQSSTATSIEGVTAPSERSTLGSLSSFCMEGYVFIQGATLIQVFERRLGNNSVPMKCE